MKLIWILSCSTLLCGILVWVCSNSVSREHSGRIPPLDFAAKIHGAVQLASTENDEAWTMLASAAKDFDSVPIGTRSMSKWQSTCELGLCAGTSQIPSFSPVHFAQIMISSKPVNVPQTGMFNQSKQQLGVPSSPENNGHDSIFFNEIALRTMQTCAQNDWTRCVSGVNFGDGSIIVRLAWMRIRKDQPCPMWVETFDPQNDTSTNHPSYSVFLDTRNCTKDADPHRRTLDDFFYVPITNTGNQVSFRLAEGSELDDSDIALILGFHAMERKEGVWHWSTFWWSSNPHFSNPNELTGYPCGLGSGCPYNKKSPNEWSNYVVATVSTPSSDTEIFTAVTNPYLEPRKKASENCIVCHSFAMTPVATAAGFHDNFTCGGQNATDTARKTLDDASAKYANSCTSQRVSASQVWTLAEHIKGSDATCDPNYCLAPGTP